MRKKNKLLSLITLLLIIILGLIIYFYLNNKLPTEQLSESEIKELFHNIENYDNIYVETITEMENFTRVSKRYQKDGIILTRKPNENNTYVFWLDTNTNEFLTIQEGHKIWYVTKQEEEDKNSYKFIGYEKYNKSKCVVVETTIVSEEENKTGELSTTNAKMWVDLKTGVSLKTEYKNSQGEEYTSYSTITLNKVKDEDVAKPNLEGYTEWKIEE